MARAPTYRFLLAGDKSAITEFQKFLEQDIKDKDLKGTRIETIENGNEQLRTTLDRADQFLSMVSVLSAMLSAVAIAMAARRFMQRHIDACAMLRCLGLTQNPSHRCAGLNLFCSASSEVSLASYWVF